MAGVEPFTLGGEFGIEKEATSYGAVRIGLAGLLSEAAQEGFAGINVGGRLQAPTRVAPFVGLGTFLGWGHRHVDGTMDGRDNNNNYAIDEFGEERRESIGFATLYPEVGVHLWCMQPWRITGSAAYYMTTEGRKYDSWVYGLYFAWLY
jgi:hypothetical protein